MFSSNLQQRQICLNLNSFSKQCSVMTVGLIPGEALANSYLISCSDKHHHVYNVLHNSHRNFHKDSVAGGKKQFMKPFMFSPKRILEASPPKYQPYLKLIRFDRPIGK